MAREIPLRNGGAAVVDDADYLALTAFEWSRSPAGYAIRYIPGSSILMHREILPLADGRDVDHADRDTLNNQRANLRAATRTQNLANQRLRRNSRTGFKGVQFRADRPSPFRARIKINCADQSLGYYDTAEEAARAYDRAATALFGEFARLNFPA